MISENGLSKTQLQHSETTQTRIGTRTHTRTTAERGRLSPVSLHHTIGPIHTRRRLRVVHARTRAHYLVVHSCHS